MLARDSIRVEGQRGALLLEVEYIEMPQFCSEEGGKFSDLEHETATLELECAALNDQMEVLQRRLEVLDGVARQIGKNALVSPESEQLRRNTLPPHSASQTQLSQLNANANGQNGTAANAQFAPTSLFLLSEDSMKNLNSFLDYYGIMMQNPFKY